MRRAQDFDGASPRFCEEARGDARNVCQTAYHLVVFSMKASSPTRAWSGLSAVAWRIVDGVGLVHMEVPVKSEAAPNCRGRYP